MRRSALLLGLLPAVLLLAGCDDGSGNVVGTSPSITVSGSPGQGPAAPPSVPGGNPTPFSQLPVPTYP